MLDLVNSSPMVTLSPDFFLAGAIEWGVSALTIHIMQTGTLLGLYYLYKSVADDINAFVTFVKDNLYIDLTSKSAMIDSYM